MEGLQHALLHHLERASEVSEKRLVGTALAKCVGMSGLETVWNALKEIPELLSATIEGERRITTQKVLAEERELLTFVREGRGRRAPLFAGTYQFKDPLYLDPAKDTEEQKSALRHILKSQDWITGLIGRAGVGKTTLLTEFDLSLKEINTPLVLVAPTSQASRGVLRKEGFKDAETVKKLLTDKNLQQKLIGAVLWIDEAGLLGMEDMLKLFKLAQQYKAAKVVLAGDPRQIRSVVRGDALRLLIEIGGLQVAYMEKIQRQRDPDLKKAIEAISQGKIDKGFQLLNKTRSLIELEDACRYETLAREWLDYTKPYKKKKRTALVVVPTHYEADIVSQQIRDGLRASVRLKGEDQDYQRLIPLNFTEAERSNPLSYASGLVVQFKQNTKGFKRGEKLTVSSTARPNEIIAQRQDGRYVRLRLNQARHFQVYRPVKFPLAIGEHVKFTENGFALDKRYRLNNGSMHIITGFTDDGDIILENTRVVSRDYGHMNHAYAITADSSQAQTVDGVFAAISEISMGALDMRRFYVTLSRARYQVKVYTDDQDALLKAAKRDAPRRTATELLRNRNSHKHARTLFVQQVRDKIKQVRQRTRSYIHRKKQEHRHVR